MDGAAEIKTIHDIVVMGPVGGGEIIKRTRMGKRRKPINGGKLSWKISSVASFVLDCNLRILLRKAAYEIYPRYICLKLGAMNYW